MICKLTIKKLSTEKFDNQLEGKTLKDDEKLELACAYFILKCDENKFSLCGH
jgi:hypothetical protein